MRITVLSGNLTVHRSLLWAISVTCLSRWRSCTHRENSLGEGPAEDPHVRDPVSCRCWSTDSERGRQSPRSAYTDRCCLLLASRACGPYSLTAHEWMHAQCNMPLSICVRCSLPATLSLTSKEYVKNTRLHYGEQYGGSLKNWKWSYCMTQQSHYWAYIWKRWKL